MRPSALGRSVAPSSPSSGVCVELESFFPMHYEMRNGLFSFSHFLSISLYLSLAAVGKSILRN